MSLDLVDQSCSGDSHECSIGEASGSYLNGFFAVWMGCVLKKAAANGEGCAWFMPEEQPQTPCRLLHFNQMVTLPQ